MSGSGAKHIRQTSLEPGWAIGQVRFRALTWDKAERADMSGYCFCNPVFMLDKFGWDLVTEKLELDRICRVRGVDMSGYSFYNPVRNLDMSGFSGNFSLRIDFDVLHFTNSPNASPLIVRMS
jgi:hypothetical protein